MKLNDCWITYAAYYATGEGMHYALAIAPKAEGAKQLFDAAASELFRSDSTTAPLGDVLRENPGARDLIPQEVFRQADDPLCWTLKYFGAIDFNCA